MSLEQKKIMVVKIGSSTLVTGEGKLDTAYLATLASQISGLRQRGWSPIIVTSGAVACGLEALGISMRPSDTPSLQAAASVGTNILVSSYARAFKAHDMLTSLVLITRQVTADREQYLHVRDTLERLLDLEVVPLINENDTVSVDQLRFGDNDTLAALVACLVKAQLCVIFSDIEGLFTANPFEDATATLIPEVSSITPDIMALASGSSSTVGSGWHDHEDPCGARAHGSWYRYGHLPRSQQRFPHPACRRAVARDAFLSVRHGSRYHAEEALDRTG